MKWTPHRWADSQIAAPRKLQALLHALASFADADGIAYPSQNKIVRRLGWSKGTVKKWSDFGRALALFSTRKRFNPRKGHCDSMTYTLHLDRVVTHEEVERQIAELRLPSPKGKSQKQGFASEGGQIATGGKQLQSHERKKAGTEEILVEARTGALGSPASAWRQATAPKRDWLMVADPKPSFSGEELAELAHSDGSTA